MPQIGWRNPANGIEKTFEEWLADAERNGEVLGLPYEVLLGIYRQQSKDRPDGFSATMLAKCARAVWLDTDTEYFSDVQSNYAAFRGTIGHSILEDFKHPEAIVERRFFRMHRDIPLSGQLDKFQVTGADPEFAAEWAQWLADMYAWELAVQTFGSDAVSVPPAPAQPVIPEGATFLIEDWKTKDKVPFGIYVYDHHKTQGNIYRWLLRAPVERVVINFVYVSMTEVKTLQVYNGGKFANGRERPKQVWSDEDVEAYLDDRLKVLVKQRRLGKPLPYAKVPTGDLWECNYCPVREACFERAAIEARQAWEKGEDVSRIPPRDKAEEEKVRLPKKTKAA